ncbi:MAG TPA: NAD(P)H-dependent oxidoreductase [Methylophilaceae bacterium]|nr:NAD(P)H-dependent oxidoreductase [Methylophilaceae bacterium]
MNILQVNSSARTEGSYSTRLATTLVQLLAQQPDTNVRVRDMARNPHPMLDEITLNALFTPAEQRTPEQAARVALNDALIDEVQAADVIVLGVPMYNFSIPVQLKNWIDAIARVGVTFRYTEKGVEGLLKGKKAYVVQASGGIHRNSPTDSITPYLKTVLGFIGITDVEFVYAEGLSMGPDAEKNGLAAAHQQIEQAISV